MFGNRQDEVGPAALGGFLIFGIIGLVVGAYRPTAKPIADPEVGPSADSWTRKILRAIVWFFHRLVIGYLMAAIVASIFTLLCLGWALIVFGSIEATFNAGPAKTRPGWEGWLAGQIGAIVAAWIGAFRARDRPPPLRSTVARTSLIASAWGAASGFFGGLAVGIFLRSDAVFPWETFFAGIMGAIMGGLIVPALKREFAPECPL